MTAAPHVHARQAIVARGRTHAVILSVTLVAIGTALGSFATSLLERRAAAAEPAGQATQSRGGSPLTDEAARAILDRLRSRLDLSDRQTEAVDAAIRSRLEAINGIKSELVRRVASEHDALDRELRRTLSEEQFSEWRQVLDEVRANRRRRGIARTERDG